MDESEMQELIDSDPELKKLSEDLEKMEGSAGVTPSSKKKESFFTFFKEILESSDSRKVSNLDRIDLQKTRGLLDIALYAEAEGLDRVSRYLTDKAENTLSTAMSRKGWFGQLLVTTIKKEQKVKEPEKKRRRLFGPKEEE